MAAKGGLGGKGLNALFTDNEENVKVDIKDMPTVEIPISEIDRNTNQPRKTFKEESLKEMASSIASYGVLQRFCSSNRRTAGISSSQAKEGSVPRRWRA